MADKMTPDEKRLYLWVRAFAVIAIVLTLIFTTFALILLPAILPRYTIGESTIVIIYGSLSTSAAAYAGVELKLRRNGK